MCIFLHGSDVDMSAYTLLDLCKPYICHKLYLIMYKHIPIKWHMFHFCLENLITRGHAMFHPNRLA